MAVSNRQNNLFAAEDWRVAYQAFTQVDFQAYDYDTIRAALVEYVRTNFPENFNDYIESSEFIAIIELLAFLSQSLVFRMDLNSRENFLETAERRDSVFKLARQLGYSPKRNIAASGVMKITSVRTSEALTDSLGNDLGNRTVFWNDANNPDSYEQFITILNRAFAGVNRFTKPAKSGTVGGIPTELYQVVTPIASPIAYPFNLTVNGVSRNFEAVNADFEDGGAFSERHPDPSNNFHLIYRNDSLGNNSANTGFFVLFKQGRLNFETFDFTNPVANRVQDFPTNNINETDVYLQRVDSSGIVLEKWTRVPNTGGQTLVYNRIAQNTGNLYSVQNLGTGGISLRFGDGNFSTVPAGNFRLWYRASDPERFTIQPDDARNITVTIPYVNADNQTHQLTIQFGLENSVSNSLPAESLARIRERAPQQFYTQDRMINNQDYQVLPLAKFPDILKLKATNKTHSGHSRYIDINDPTSTFQTVSNFADDGVLYKQLSETSSSVTVSNNRPAQLVAENDVPALLRGTQLNDFVYDAFRKSWQAARPEIFDLSRYQLIWKTQPRQSQGDTGYILENFTDPGTPTVLLNNLFVAGDYDFRIIQSGNLLKFVDPTNSNNFVWSQVTSIENSGALISSLNTADGPIEISDNIPNNWRITDVVVSLRTTLTSSETTAVVDQLETAVTSNRNTFGMGYDPESDSWYVIDHSELDRTSAEFDPVRPVLSTDSDSSWLLRFTYVPVSGDTYRFAVEIRGLDYIFESQQDLRFYSVNSNPVVDEDTGIARQDVIELTTINTKPDVTETFVWSDSGSDDVADAWYLSSTDQYYTPVGTNQNLPLQTRSTGYKDVSIQLQSNFGLYTDGDSNTDTFVSDVRVTIPTSNADNTANIVIADNSGTISSLPGNLTIPFDSTTFGAEILNASGNIQYRAYDAAAGEFYVYAGSTSTVAQSNANSVGKIIVQDANVITQTGNLVIQDFSTVAARHSAADGDGVVVSDKLIVKYVNTVSLLDQPLQWNIVEGVTYADGYVDPRKVSVTPVRRTGDLAPELPEQFDLYVGDDDVVLFEFYTDLDGYQYSRPVVAPILDLRREASISVNQSEGIITVTTTPGAEFLINDYDWILVNTLSEAQQFENTLGKFSGKIIYVYGDDTVYELVASSTNVNRVSLFTTDEYFVKSGRGFSQNTLEVQPKPTRFRWDHFAPLEIRIDPSISNIIEMFVLTDNYNNQIQAYLNTGTGDFPAPPTSAELATQFSELNNIKAASDQLVFRSAKFKPLFGADAAPELQARFKVVKLPGVSLTDNEVRTRVLNAINDYFNIANWDFGETFYFTELSSYIHQQVGNAIGSIVIVPTGADSQFGNLFQVKANSDELFISTATIDDIEIVDKLTANVLRTGN